MTTFAGFFAGDGDTTVRLWLLLVSRVRRVGRVVGVVVGGADPSDEMSPSRKLESVSVVPTDAADEVAERWVIGGMSMSFASLGGVVVGVGLVVISFFLYAIAVERRVVGPPRRTATAAGPARRTLATVEDDILRR